jgi:hypothetical protein
MRIQARAIDRMGTLLESYEKAQGERSDKLRDKSAEVRALP